MRARAVVLASSLLAASIAAAGEVYKWTDEHGQVHFSNREAGSSSGAESEPPRSREGEGWESVLERQQGSQQLSEQADAAMNGLVAERRRQRRERDRARTELEAIQLEIGQAEQGSRPDVPALRVLEASKLTELGRMESGLAEIERNLAKLRALKQLGKERAESAENPLGR